MIYLKDFTLPSIEEEERANSTFCSIYPFGFFPQKKLSKINFSDITIFYGNNGSGKSTLLNCISKKLDLPRKTYLHNTSFFDLYVNICKYTLSKDEEGLNTKIPKGSKIIASEDIFDNILSTRIENMKIDEREQIKEKEYLDAKYSKIDFSDYDRLSLQNEARSKSLRKFVTKRVGIPLNEFSNGETALSYFNKEFLSGNLYLLDEPENSLSPEFQIELAKLIIECTFYCDCQFIIATHSPFILSLKDATIYDLSTTPSKVKPWYMLDNMKIYYKFFSQNSNYFKE